jgi:hypothetical protein
MRLKGLATINSPKPSRFPEESESENMSPTPQILTRTHLIVFVSIVVLSLGVWALWMRRYQVQVARRDEMHALYASGSGGDLDSVKRLADYPSPEAMQLIQNLAQDRRAFADGRLEAINILANRRPFDPKTIVPLISIDQPFVVRHATAKAFEKHGCEDQCISATLSALYAISHGQPTSEMQAAAQIPSPTADDQQDLLYLHKQTEEDYFSLLNSNPCLAHNLLGTGYLSDSSFVGEIQKNLHPCHAP